MSTSFSNSLNTIAWAPGETSREGATAILQHAASMLLRERIRADRASGDEARIRDLCTHPATPEEVLLELCKDERYVDDLGHRTGPRRVLEELALRYQYPEAILTVARELYESADEPCDALLKFILPYRDRVWLYESLARLTPSGDEKRELLRSLSKGSKAEERVSQLLAMQADLILAGATADQEKIAHLAESSYPDVVRALILNPNTPREVLARLSKATNGPSARLLRNLAQQVLTRRG